ncbi:MAG: hypothetical protein ACREIS_13475 [Nitrospiraceae bacterium]
MALITPRVYHDNLLKRTGAVITSSSQEAAFPKQRVLDPRRSKVWRSKLGFNVQAGINDRLDYNEGGVDKNAVIAPGNYPTGALLAVEVTTAMNAVAVANTYLVTYSSVTRKFTIARATGVATISLEWFTGAFTLDTIGRDLGFDVTADDTAATSYLGDFAVQMSGEWVRFDLLTALLANAAIVLESNLTGAGTIKAQGNATSDFAAPTFSTTLIGGDPDDGSKYLDFFSAAQTFRHWRILVEDRDNPAGFAQLGVAFIGPLVTFDRCYALNLPEARQELSEIVKADQGAIYTDVKPARREWAFSFRETTDPDKAKWEDIAQARHIGDHLFYALDPLNKPLTHTVYGYIRPPGISFEHIRSDVEALTAPLGHWNVSFPFSEDIG